MISRKYIFYGVALILFVIFLIIQGNPNRDLCLRQQEEFNNEDYRGIVNRLFLDDKNHRALSLEILHNDSSFTKWLFGIKSMTALFSNTSPGDTIIKKKGENVIYIKSQDGVAQYEVDLACED
jgi:hypothetical protein